MKISELGRDSSVVRSKNSQASEQVEGQNNDAEYQAGLSGDRVSISPLARQFAQISELVSEGDAKRRARVEELKKQYEEGTLSVSSEEVAKSIVRHITES